MSAGPGSGGPPDLLSRGEVDRAAARRRDPAQLYAGWA
jgi:hypothetical protein